MLVRFLCRSVNAARFRLQFGVWDTPGRLKFGADELYKVLPQTDVYVVCFNVARPVSLERARALAAIALAASPDAYFVIVGCAADLREHLKV